MRKILFIILLLPIIGYAQEPETLVHNSKYYVDDYAGVFSADQVTTLDRTIRGFFDTAQISIVTINSFGSITPADYATRLGRKWGVGGASNTGLLIVIGIKDRHVEVATGYGIEGDLPDIMVVELQHEFAVPNFKQGKYYEGTKQLLDAYINKLSPSAKALRQKEDAEQKLKREANWDKTKNVLFIIILILGVGALIYIPFYVKRRKKRIEEERLADQRERERIDSLPFIAASAAVASQPYYSQPSSNDNGSSYTSPSYSSNNDSYSSGSSDSGLSSGGSDFGGGSFGGGGGGSDW